MTTTISPKAANVRPLTPSLDEKEPLFTGFRPGYHGEPCHVYADEYVAALVAVSEIAARPVIDYQFWTDLKEAQHKLAAVRGNGGKS